MVDGRGEIDGVLALVGRREADLLGVIFALLVDIGHFVNGVGDLLDADHVVLRCCLFPVENQALERASAPMTSAMAPPRCAASGIRNLKLAPIRPARKA